MATIPQPFLDEVRARTPLPALIGRRTRLARAGAGQAKGCCPFHQENTPSFYVYEDHFHCFGCGAHGDAIAFVMRSEGATFLDALERLAGEAGLTMPEKDVDKEAAASAVGETLAAAEAAFRRRLRDPEGRAARDYLQRRGVSDESIERFGIGWSGSGRGSLVAELQKQGISGSMMVDAGLARRQETGEGVTELFFNRVMFPIRDKRGRTISFGGRVLDDSKPKYINGPESPAFQKRRHLYGVDQARGAMGKGGVSRPEIMVVEGYLDVIALNAAGFTGAVAPLGTALTPEQMEELWRMSPVPILCFDGDAAGAKAAARAAEAALPLITPERSLRFAVLPEGEDPDTLLGKGGAQAFDAVLAAAKPMSDVLYTMIAGPRPAATPEQRAALRDRLEAAAKQIPHRALAAEYRRTLLDRFFATFRTAPSRQGGPSQGFRSQAAGFGSAGKERFSGRGAAGFAQRMAQRPILGTSAVRPDPAAVRDERLRILLAILIRHPAIIPEVEEHLDTIDMEPGGRCDRIRRAVLAWHRDTAEGDAEGFADCFSSGEIAADASWILRASGLPACATPDASPEEALKGWWHFYGYARGESALIADRDDAMRALMETNDPAAQRRLVLLTEAISAQRSGDRGEGLDW